MYVLSKHNLWSNENEKIKLDTCENGDSFFCLDNKKYLSDFGRVKKNPDGFRVIISNDIGEKIFVYIRTNKDNRISGFEIEISAESFENAVAITAPLIITFLNSSFVLKYKTPFYIKRIVAWNDVGWYQAWLLFGPKERNWDLSVLNQPLSLLQRHVISLTKDAILNYHNPIYQIVAYYKVYEIFERVVKHAKEDETLLYPIEVTKS